MSTEILQVRDVDSDDLAILRRRAATEGKSLSAYMRERVHELARRPTAAELVASVEAFHRAHPRRSGPTVEDVLDAIDAERR